MKKITKILTCLTLCISFTGCFSKVYTRNANNDLEVSAECKDVSDINTLVDNIKIMSSKVNAISAVYELTNTKDTYKITFDAITKDKRLNWDLKAQTVINDNEVKVYFKDGKFYLIYPNNGANIIVKDNISNVITETRVTLDKLNASYDRDNLNTFITGDKLAGFEFERMKEEAIYVLNNDGSYTITHDVDGTIWTYSIASNYLITSIDCKAANFSSKLNFSYPSNLTINYPNGLDFFTVDIDDVKKILEIDSFAEVIDESIKDAE